MTFLRFSTLAIAGASLLALSGCQEYFGTNEGFDEGGSAWGVGGQVAGSADFEIIGVTPSTAEAGEQVDLVMVSASDAPVGDFVVDDFWFCTFDGESAMLETGGDDFEAEVDADVFSGNDDIDLTNEDLDGGTVSTVTFTVPGDTVTGESLMFDPSGAVQYFDLGIQ
ncbi:MAG: hypothetical protein KDA24_19205 [Deltaproteobacteria bacterium]|nr:hypothetical protein [Deltaproteobacteria bacterium]